MTYEQGYGLFGLVFIILFILMIGYYDDVKNKDDLRNYGE